MLPRGGEPSPVRELLGDEQVLEVVVDGPLVLLQQGEGVAQAVAGLRLHHLIPQLPGQLQGFPGHVRATDALIRKTCERLFNANTFVLLCIFSLAFFIYIFSYLYYFPVHFYCDTNNSSL